MADIRRRPSNKDVVDPVIHSIIVPRERVAPLSPTGATAVIHRGFDLLRCPNPNVFAFGFVRRPSRRITLSRRVEKTRSPPSRDRHSTSRQASLSYANPIAHRFSAGVHTRLSVGCITHPCIPSGLDFFVGDLAGLFDCSRRYPSLPVVVKFFSYRGTAFAARMDFGIVA